MKANRFLLAEVSSIVSVLMLLHVVCTDVFAANDKLANASSKIATAHKDNIAELESVEYSISLDYTYSPLTALMRSENGLQKYAAMSSEQKKTLRKAEYVKSLHHYRIVMQSGNIRYERSGQAPTGNDSKMVAFHNLSTNNIDSSKSLSRDVSGQYGYDHGIVYSHKANEVTMEIAMLPVLLSYYGPGNPKSGIPDLGTLELVSGEVEAGDIQLRARLGKGANEWTEAYTFAEEANFCLSQISRARVSGEPMSEYSITALSDNSFSHTAIPSRRFNTARILRGSGPVG